MKRLYLSVVLTLGITQMGIAQKSVAPDSVKMEALNEVVVKAVKAPANAPFAVTKIDRKQLETFSRTGQ